LVFLLSIFKVTAQLTIITRKKKAANQNVWTFLWMQLSEVRSLKVWRCSLKCGSKKTHCTHH